jgi:hypothetical protein
MRKVLLTLGILALICSPAMAGKNENGSMVVHTNDSYTYSGQTVCTATQGDPGTCEAAGLMATKDAGQVVWLLAAFLPGSSPGVSVIYFGIRYDDACLDPGVAKTFCGPPNTLEVPDTDWPYTGRGNSVAFGSPVVGDILFPFYAFKIDNFCGFGPPAPYFGTGINPTGGYAGFVDDSNPPVLDYCTQFGEVHWGEPGVNECPEPPTDPTGACCFADGSCQVTTQANCQGISWTEDGVCNPNPCEQPSACCFEDGSCAELIAIECERAGGTHFPGQHCTDDPSPCFVPPVVGACCVAGVCVGDDLTEDECTAQDGLWFQDQTCDQVTCPPVATESTTWGQIKATYR